MLIGTKELELLVYHVRNKTELVLLKDVFSKEDNKRIQEAMGSKKKTLQQSEQDCLRKLGKTVVAKVNIPKDSIISEESVTIKVAEPPGIDPKLTDLYIGKVAKYDIGIDDSISIDDLTTIKLEIVQQLEGSLIESL